MRYLSPNLMLKNIGAFTHQMSNEYMTQKYEASASLYEELKS